RLLRRAPAQGEEHRSGALDGEALGKPGRPPQVVRRAGRHRDHGRVRAPGAAHPPRPPRRRDEAEGHDRAPGVRPLTKGFGPGYNGPLAVVITGNLRAASLQKLAKDLYASAQGLTDVAQISPPVVSPNGKIAIVQVTPKSSPQSEETKDLVRTLRSD